MAQNKNDNSADNREGIWSKLLMLSVSLRNNAKKLLYQLIGRRPQLAQKTLLASNESTPFVAADLNDTATEDRERILSNGWQQGALAVSSQEIHASFNLPDDDCDAYILVSHSCDVLAYKYKTEPLVEFIGGTYSRKANKSLSNRRHPRQLQLPIDGGEKPFLTLNINLRYFVNRRALADVPSSPISLTHQSLKELQMWMAARYRRTAFPDEFINRISAALTSVRKELEINGDKGVHSLYVHLDPFEELKKECEYNVVLMGTAEGDLGEIKAPGWRDAENFLEFVANQLDSCEGIAVQQYELVAEEGITLATLRRLRLLDFDYISHKENTEVPEMIG